MIGITAAGLLLLTKEASKVESMSMEIFDHVFGRIYLSSLGLGLELRAISNIYPVWSVVRRYVVGTTSRTL